MNEMISIFILIKKVKNYPLLKTKYTNLYILQKRTDIRWGHISQIKAEYALFDGCFYAGSI